MGGPRHPWKFFRAGGVDQVVLSSGEDIANLDSLDQKLWVALACPAKGLELDARTLAMLDVDKDGRIRPPDLLGAIAWLKEALNDLGEVFEATDELPLSSLSTETTIGKDLRAGAQIVLDGLGKAKKGTITLADVSNTEALFAATKFNGDGIVPADSAEDAPTQAAIADIIATLGSVEDRSKKPGVDQAKVDAFFDQAKAYVAWLEAGKTPEVRVLGDRTPPAALALEDVRAKVDDYFARTRVAAFEPRAIAAMNAGDADLVELGSHVLSAQADEASKLPLAKIEAGRPLPLDHGLNPAWMQKMQAFAKTTVPDALGSPRPSLSEEDWTRIKDKLLPYTAWQSGRPETQASKLGDERLTALTSGDARAKVTELIGKDAALAVQIAQIESVEKLIHFRRDLVTLLQNFVNFSVFYSRRKAIFQAGTLYLDGRTCDLCLTVDDVARHALLAGKSQAYLVYCDCTRKQEPGKRVIVAALTGGDVDNVVVGRNGIFYDRAGADWDATVTKIVENPISIRQAFWQPYKRFVTLVEDAIAKRAQAADAESGKKMEAAAVDVGGAGSTTVAAGAAGEAEKKPAAGPKPVDVGTVAAIGVAVGGVATFFSSVLATFLGLGMWMPFGLIALVLAISGPSMLLAWLKLRKRNIGPLLDAGGWAVNAMALVNVPFGASLTSLARIPDGASRTLGDPFAQKKVPWRSYLFVGAVLVGGAAWFFGALDTYLPDKAKAATVMHRSAPSAPSK